MKFLAVVVTYNTIWQASLTLRSLLKVSYGCNVDVLVWDNTPTSLLDHSVIADLKENFRDVTTHWDGENTPLSKIYNFAADLSSDYDCLVLLDDDSCLPTDFFEELRRSSSLNPHVDLFLPIVRCGERIVSPGKMFIFKGRHWSSEQRGSIRSKGTVGITSGMAVRSRYIREFPRPFNESLDFYGVDTDFLMDFSSRRDELFVTNTSLSHDSSLWQARSEEEFLKRFAKLRHSWFVTHRRHPVRLIFLAIYAAGVSARHAVRYRNWRFLFPGERPTAKSGRRMDG